MAVHIENSTTTKNARSNHNWSALCPTMTVSLPPLPEGWRDDVVYMLHDFLEDAGLAQTLCALEQETGYAPAQHPPTRTAPQIHFSDSNFPPVTPPLDVPY